MRLTEKHGISKVLNTFASTTQGDMESSMSCCKDEVKEVPDCTRNSYPCLPWQKCRGPNEVLWLGGSTPSTKALGMDIDRAWVLSKGFKKELFPKGEGAEGIGLGYPLLNQLERGAALGRSLSFLRSTDPGK